MKSQLAICFVLLLLTAQAGNAQIVRQFSCRLAASSNNQTFSFSGGPSATPAKRLRTIDAGIYAEVFPSSHFSFLLGAEYQVRGGGDGVKYFSYYLLETQEIQTRTGYISLPLLLKCRAERNSVTPYIVSGPSLSFPLSPTYYPLVLGATIGAGLEVADLLPCKLIIDLRYSFDLTHTIDEWLDDIDVRSNAIDCGVGFGF